MPGILIGDFLDNKIVFGISHITTPNGFQMIVRFQLSNRSVYFEVEIPALFDS